MVPALLRPARQNVFGIELGGFAGETIVRRTSTSTAERLQERPGKKKQIHRNGTHAFELGLHDPETKAGLTSYFTFYNQTRPHQSLDGKTPDEVYFGNPTLLLAA